MQLGTEEGTETYAELALLTNDALSDSSVISVYGYNASAHFCQHLGKTNPFIFDWLLDHSTAEERVQFRSIMHSLTSLFAEYGRPGVMAKLVNEEDIGPLLLWTTLASEYQVSGSSLALRCAPLATVRMCMCMCMLQRGWMEVRLKNCSACAWRWCVGGDPHSNSACVVSSAVSPQRAVTRIPTRRVCLVRPTPKDGRGFSLVESM